MSQSIQIQVTQVGLEQSIAAAMKRVGSSSQINLGTSSKQINALSQPLGRITGQADEFSKSMAAANARVLAFGASAGIIAGVSKAMSGLVTSTIKVEKSLTEINSILNKSGAELDKFGQQIFNVAKNTGKSFDEVASGALELARQGLNAEDTLARLNDALILSRLSGLDAAQSVEGLTAAFNSFQKSGITTAEILNKVVAVSQKYAVSERDIIEGVKRSASVAQQAGVSFDELAAVITAVQQTTARGGAVIGNSFKTIFARIQRKDVLSDLQNMGVAVTDLQGNVLPALRILENLAGQLNNFSQIEQADIAEKLGGVFQLDKLLSALKDLSSEASVTRGALKAAGEAGNSAYQKNIILNQTLAALLNKVAVNAEQLGAKLGEIGVTDSLKNVLGIFNDLLEGIQKVLGEESGLGNLVRGLVKGLGSFLAGPGLALFGGIILKLSKDLVQFGFASLKTFFGIGKAAKEVQSVEGAISQILAKNVNLQQQLFALEGNRAAQLRLITGALVEQEALLRKSANISSGLAKPLYNVGVRAGNTGLRIPNSADGYMPAVAKESKAIKQGVGGARSGDKPVVIPNFNFGGGKKGTMVAHTGEYVVPNFNGSGGSAVFNRQMVQSMGLPSGAKKIGAAGGFVPNFARGTGLGPAGFLDQLDLTGAESVDQVRSILSRKFSVTNSSDKALTVGYGNESIYITNDNISKSLAKKSQLSKELYYNSNADPAALMLVPQNKPFDPNALNTKFTKKKIQEGVVFDGFIGGLAGINPNPDDKKFASLTNVDNEIAQALSSSAVNILRRIEPGIEIQPDSLLDPKNILNSVLQEGGAGAFGAFKGALFESIIKLVSKGKSQEDGKLDVDLNQGREALESIFGIKGKNYRFADFKNSLGQKDKFISQVMNNLPVSSYPAKQQRGMASAAGGYIPNFAAQRNVGYLDGDVLSDPRYAATVKEQIAKLGIKGGTAEYHKYLGDLVSQARASGKLKKFTGIYGVPGAGKSTMMFGGGIGPKADAAKGRKTNRIPIITPEDIAKVSEVIDTRASLLGTMKALEGGYLSNVDRMMILSSSTTEEQSEIQRRRNLRDAQIKAGTSATAFGRTAGTSQGAALDSGYIEAMALSILGPDKVSVMGVRPDFKLARKKGSQLPLVESKKIGLAYGAFSPSTKGHAELLKMAQKEGISPENFIAAVSKEGGTIDQNDPHSWRTALFPQGFRNYLMQKTVPGANVINASQDLFAGSIPRMLEVSPNGNQRRFVKAQQGSLAFVGSDKTEKDLEKYIKSGYDVRVGDRTTGISGTAAREAIDNLDSQSIAKIFTKGAVEVINQYLPQMKNRSNIFPEIIKRVNSKVDNQLSPIEQALSLLPARKSKTTPPEVAAQMDELREARDKLKKLKQKIPNVMLRRLGKLFPDKYGLPSAAGGFIPNFAGGSNIIKKIKEAAVSNKGSLGYLLKTFVSEVMFDGFVSPEEIDQIEEVTKFVLQQDIKRGGRRKFEAALKDPETKRQLEELQRMMRSGSGNAAGGFVPNFANPLQDAVNREMAAGVPASQIYIDKSPALKNAANPMGLMVANRRDEPAGGFQGINRARKEGANPMTYGAASGFVPNYASLTKAVSKETGIKIYAGPVQDAIDKFAKESLKAGADMKKLAKQLEDQLKIVTQGNPISKQLAQVAQEETVKRKEIIAAKALESTAGKKVYSKLDKILQEYNQSEKTAKDLTKAQAKAAAALNKTTLNEIKKSAITSSIGSLAATRPGAQPRAGGNRDMLGTIFAVQGAMSALTGATDEATSGFSKFTNSLASSLGTITTTLFAVQGISQAIGKEGTKLGAAVKVIGARIIGLTVVFQGISLFYSTLKNINKDYEKSSEALARFNDTSFKFADYLENSEIFKTQSNNTAKNIIKNAEYDFYKSKGFNVTGVGLDKLSGDQLSGRNDVLQYVDRIRKTGLISDEELKTKIQNIKDSSGNNAELASAKLGEISANLTAQSNVIFKDTEDFFKKERTPQERENFTKKYESAGISQKLMTGYVEAFEKKRSKEAEDKLAIEKESIEQINTSLAQDKLRNSIAEAIANSRRFENDVLNKSLLKSKELGNLDEKGLRELEDKIALREIDRKLEDEAVSLIQSQIDKAKDIVAKKDEALKLEQKLKNLTPEQLRDQSLVLGVLNETNQLLSQGADLSQADIDAARQKLENLLKNNDAEKKSLEFQQKKTAELKEQNRQLDLISQASKRALQGQLFSGEISTARSINSNNAQIRTLESSKLGRDEVQIRQIDQQIAELKKNNILLEQSNAKEKIFQDMKAELSENNKVTNEEIKQSLENQIKQAKTIEQLEFLAGAIFLQNKGQDEELNKSKLQDFIQKYQESLIKQGIDAEEARKQAEAEVRDAGRISPVIDALEMFRRSLLATSQIIDQKIEDIKLQQLTSISGKEILQGNYDIETLRQQRGQTPAEAARIARQRQNKGLGQLFAEEYTKTDEERALNINQAIVDGSVQFKNNMIEGIMGAIEGTGDLKDGLRSAAYEFVKMINQRMMSNLVDKLVGGSVPSGGGAPSGGLAAFFSNMFASGGKVTGGSGSKDDVPAMLMGGEYVVNKKAVAKYGPQFLEAINNGTLSGYAKGGTVQRGPQGNFYTPGTFGQGAISGKRNLLDFATQSGTSGKFDQIINESGYQAISLEPESSRLSVSGMRSTPMFEATQSAKGQAFDLYLQQYNAEREAKKQAKEQKKALIRQVGMLALSAALGPALGAAGAGFKAAFGAAKAGGVTGFQSFLAGTKGIFTGGKIPGMEGNVGGLGNLFSGVGKAFTGDFGGAINKFKLSQIGTQEQLLSAMKNEKFASYINQQGGFIPKAQVAPSLGGIPIGASRGANGVTFNSNDGDIIKNIQGDVGVYGSDIEAGLLPSMQGKSGFNIFKSIGSGANKIGSIFSNFLGSGYGPFDKDGNYVEEWADNPSKWGISQFVRRATGGTIPSTSGIDTVPAMLSGGEFVMNRSAVQSIGAPNLQSMNAGGTSITSEETSKELNEKLLAKLDELIKVSDSSAAGNITINVAPSGQTTQEGSQDASANRQQLARQIKDAVLQVINDEKRIGGSLRR